jgi:uncharacterized damage-inducible protein DinB
MANNNDHALREQIVGLLSKGEAHLTFEDAIKGLPADARSKKPAGAAHSPWELIEHMRIAQKDILEFTKDGRHKSPKFPAGYWPDPKKAPSDDDWENCLKGFKADLAELVAMAKNDSIDLFSQVPHGSGQTVLRELLLVADHNAYHLGELVVTLRSLGVWSRS